METKTAWQTKPQSEKPSIARFDAQYPNSQAKPKSSQRGSNTK